LGGLEEAFKTKNEQRVKFKLPVIVENPSQVINQMSPATPPPNPIDLVNDLQLANPNSSYKRKKVSWLCWDFYVFFLLPSKIKLRSYSLIANGLDLILEKSFKKV